MDHSHPSELFEKSRYTWIFKFSRLKAKYKKGSYASSSIFPQTSSVYKWRIHLFPNGWKHSVNSILVLITSKGVSNNIFAKYILRLQKSNDEVLAEKEDKVAFLEKRSRACGHLEIMNEEMVLLPVHDDTIKIRVFILTKIITLQCHNTFGPPLKLSEDFGSMFKSGEFCDFTLKFNDNGEICVHKAILAARSSVFRGMFNHYTSESKLGHTTITDIDKDTMSRLLEFMYTGVLRNLSKDETTKLLPAADKYDLIELKQLCVEILVDELDVSSVLEILLLAELHNVAELKHIALDYIIENASKFSDVSKYTELRKYPDLLIELLTGMAKLSDKLEN